MTKQTKTTAVVASLYCFALVVLLALAVGGVYHQKSSYRELATTLAEQAAKESSARSIARVLEVSASDREVLDAAFLSEKDTIAFITKVEGVAVAVGAALETKDIAALPKTDSAPAQLKMSFVAEGTYAAVKNFMTALEALPYHLVIPTMTLRAGEGAVWSGTVEVLVTQTP